MKKRKCSNILHFSLVNWKIFRKSMATLHSWCLYTLLYSSSRTSSIRGIHIYLMSTLILTMMSAIFQFSFVCQFSAICYAMIFVERTFFPENRTNLRFHTIFPHACPSPESPIIHDIHHQPSPPQFHFKFSTKSSPPTSPRYRCPLPEDTPSPTQLTSNNLC